MFGGPDPGPVAGPAGRVPSGGGAADSGGYQRPSEAFHQPGPGGSSAMVIGQASVIGGWLMMCSIHQAGALSSSVFMLE